MKQEEARKQPHEQEKEKKPYRAPELRRFGDLRDLTLGGTGLEFESGQTGVIPGKP